jgi:hypothetical protein
LRTPFPYAVGYTLDYSTRLKASPNNIAAKRSNINLFYMEEFGENVQLCQAA